MKHFDGSVVFFMVSGWETIHRKSRTLVLISANKEALSGRSAGADDIMALAPPLQKPAALSAERSRCLLRSRPNCFHFKNKGTSALHGVRITPATQPARIKEVTKTSQLMIYSCRNAWWEPWMSFATWCFDGHRCCNSWRLCVWIKDWIKCFWSKQVLKTSDYRYHIVHRVDVISKENLTPFFRSVHEGYVKTQSKPHDHVML